MLLSGEKISGDNLSILDLKETAMDRSRSAFDKEKFRPVGS